MEQNLLRRNLWNTAGKAGLALGGASSVFLLISHAMTSLELPGFVSSVISFAMWAAKFGGCIWLMAFFMKKFVAENPEADNSASYRFGMASAFLSALIFAAVTFADVAFISADMYSEMKVLMMQEMSSLMDSNTAEMMEKTFDNLPQYMFFANLIYCFLYGTVLSAILSRNIPSRNPFADYKPEDQ